MFPLRLWGRKAGDSPERWGTGPKVLLHFTFILTSLISFSLRAASRGLRSMQPTGVRMNQWSWRSLHLCCYHLLPLGAFSPGYMLKNKWHLWVTFLHAFIVKDPKKLWEWMRWSWESERMVECPESMNRGECICGFYILLFPLYEAALGVKSI